LDPQRSIPIVWGLLKTRLQLPSEAQQWSDEQLQSVLLHELAHVRRRDLFVLALTQIAVVSVEPPQKENIKAEQLPALIRAATK
jgi:hypothetical protein